MFKINISQKDGKTFHLETEAESLMEKSLHDKIKGEDISRDLQGYEFEITGASDKSGFAAMENVEGIALKKVLLTYGKSMKKKPRGEKKKGSKPKGLRLRKTVRGKIISPAISQINLKILREGNKKLSEIFPEQCKKKETKQAPKTEEKTEGEKNTVDAEDNKKITEKLNVTDNQSSKNKELTNQENSEPTGEAKSEE